MPTIEELAPATASADSDELPVSQNSVTRKITRAQILAGMQTQLSIPAGTLLGRKSQTLGGPETIIVGNYLNLVSGTLSAAAAPFSISSLPAGLVPSANDLIPISQVASQVYVSYATFLQGISAQRNIDGSQLLVTAPGGSTTLKLADLIYSLLPMTGGSLSGPLTLATDPTSAMSVATKQYVDSKINRVGDTLYGPLFLSADPSLALQAATKFYVDNNSAFPRTGFTVTGPVILAGDPLLATGAATKSYTDMRVLRTGDTMTGPLTLSSDPTVRFHASTKNYVDSVLASALPITGGLLTGPISLPGDPLNPMQAATKQYADGKVARTGDTLSGFLTLSGNPSSIFHAATKNYVDTQASTFLSKAGGTMAGPILLAGNPSLPAHAATKFYVDSGMAAVLPLSGGTMVGPIMLMTGPSSALQVVNKQYVDSQVGACLPLIGGSLSGNLTLNTAPNQPLHVVTKQYVDANPGPSGVINIRLPPCNAQLDGTTDDTPAFIAAYQLAPAGGTIYVPNGIALVQTSLNWGIPLVKRVKWIIDGTLLTDGAPLADAVPMGSAISGMSLPGTSSGQGTTGSVISQSVSQSSDFSVSHNSYVVNHSGGAIQSVISNVRADTIITQDPANHVWAGVDRLVWNGTQTGSGSTPSKHIARYVQAIRQTVGSSSLGLPLPQPLMWSTYHEFTDKSGQPSSVTNASVTMEVNWTGNGLDDAGRRRIQTIVLAQNDPAGPPVEVSSAVSVSVASGSVGKIFRVLQVAVPYSVSVLDTVGATQLAGAAAIRLGSGHSIAFEPTNVVNVSYSAAVGAMIAKYGATSCAIGKGISVSYGIVFAGNATLAASSAGSVVFLVGSNQFMINLPAANAVAAGTGFTFSVLGNATVSIVPASGDLIELGPIVVRQYDRYHVVSDGSSLWREIFRTNSVSPRFNGPPVLPSFPILALPSVQPAGAKAFVFNGRKPGEGPGAGTGIEVFFDGVQWISVCSGTPVSG